jgi:hypothetical protein
MELDPFVRWSLWPPCRRILPGFLPSVGGGIKQVEDEPERLRAPVVRIPGEENPVTITQEGTDGVVFLVVEGDPEILVWLKVVLPEETHGSVQPIR